MDPGSEEVNQLRHVEKDVLIPKMVREKSKELCSDKVEAFTKCCQKNGFLMVVKCREENAALKECLTDHSAGQILNLQILGSSEISCEDFKRKRCEKCNCFQLHEH
ncbi:COX assembly mitochondrial protein homolog isoform X2 [Heterodontus francisci]|uniref:COX assembly mitochondrial protein homolog isoform X2 n=1 Tax=Heterodontus francisci TaxID=7792 RepID=UPI00355AFD3D